MVRLIQEAGTLLATGLLALPVPAQQANRIQGPASRFSPVPAMPDCNRNGIPDDVDLSAGMSQDCDGNQVPDECDVGRVTLLSESFESGLPAGWGATGQWHITGACSPIPRSDGLSYAYYGRDAECSFEDGFFASFGTLSLPPIVLPTGTQLIELSYASSYEGEDEEPYDAANVLINGLYVDHVSAATQQAWQTRTLDLTAYAGQSISVLFHFDTVDGFTNGVRGWQVDNVRLTYTIGPAGADCNSNGVPDTCEPDCNVNGMPDECDFSLGLATDCNFNGIPDECDTTLGSSADCNLNGIPDECDLSISLPAALQNLAASATAITGLFPNTREFYGGHVGTCITQGPDFDLFLFDCGNRLNTNLQSGIDYTNGTAISSTAFGPDSSYFTAKYPGLFVMAATGCSIDRFEISGQTYGVAGVVDSLQITTTVGGQIYTGFVKRTFGSSPASINQIMIVPGDGTGVTHTFSPDVTSNEQVLDGLAGIDRIYYVLVSRLGSGGLALRHVDAREVMREVLASFPAPFSEDLNASGIPDECE